MRHSPQLVGEVALGDMERLGVAVVRWRQPAHVGRPGQATDRRKLTDLSREAISGGL